MDASWSLDARGGFKRISVEVMISQCHPWKRLFLLKTSFLFISLQLQWYITWQLSCQKVMKWRSRRVLPKEDFCGSHETFYSFCSTWSISLSDVWLPGLEKFDSHSFLKSVTKVSSVSSSQGLIIGLYVVNLTPSGDKMGREVCKMIVRSSFVSGICRSLGKRRGDRKTQVLIHSSSRY